MCCTATEDALPDDFPGFRRDVEPRRFPTRMVAILTLTATVYCYNMASLFPYVGVMVEQLLSLETANEAGYYAGYVASAFTFGHILSGYVWGYFTDSVGRKPTIIIGLLSMTAFSLAFGMSTSYAWALTSRLVLGLTNGIIPALRVSLKEICGPEHMLMGMAYLSSCKAIGTVVGTGIGGLLSQPALHFPNVFSSTGLFGRYPFLLPNLVGAICALITPPLVMVYLPETKGVMPAAKEDFVLQLDSGDNDTNSYGVADAGPSRPSFDGIFVSSPAVTGTNKYQELTTPVSAAASVSTDDSMERGNRRHSDDSGGEEGGAENRESTAGGGYQLSATNDQQGVQGKVEAAAAEEEEEKDNIPGVFGRGGLLSIPHVKVLLFLACIVHATQIGFSETYPLYALSTPDVGGLGWNSLQIGKVLILAGILVIVIQFVILPSLIKAVGITTGQRVGFVLSSLAFLVVPAGESLSWNYSSLNVIFVAASAVINCSISAIVLALAVGSTTLVPSGMRGKLGGLHNTAESFGNCVGPSVFATMYAWSISPSGSASAYDWVDYHFVFYVSASIMALCAVVAWRTLTHENLMNS